MREVSEKSCNKLLFSRILREKRHNCKKKSLIYEIKSCNYLFSSKFLGKKSEVQDIICNTSEL